MADTIPQPVSAAEANVVAVKPVPGAIFLRMRRAFPGEPRREMFAEMTPGEVTRLIAELQASLRVALATITPETAPCL